MREEKRRRIKGAKTAKKQTVKEMLAEIKEAVEMMKVQLTLINLRLQVLEGARKYPKFVPVPYPKPVPPPLVPVKPIYPWKPSWMLHSP